MDSEEIMNIYKFKKWLFEKAKRIDSNDYLDRVYLIETLEELKNQYYRTGNCEYELSKFESKSGNPETYQYEVKIVKDEINDIFEITFIL